MQRFIDHILQEASERAKSILEKAQGDAEELIENQRQLARQKAAQDERYLSKRTEDAIAIIRGRVIADAQRRAVWMVLSEKERLVTCVITKVKSAFEELSKTEEYAAVLEKMIVNGATMLGGGDLEVMLDEQGSSLPLRLNLLAEKVAAKTGVKTQLKLSAEKNTAHGVVVKTIDGKIVVDNTFETILKRREKELRLKIARILFSD